MAARIAQPVFAEVDTVPPQQDDSKRVEWRKHRAQWDGLARTMPDLFLASSTQYYRRCEIALIRRTLGPLRGKKVLKLDLWNEAFNTRILQWMRAEGAEAVGTDISAEVACRARQNCPSRSNGLHLVQSDIRHLPFDQDSFDFVYTMGTIEHIEEYELAVREVQRVLKTGGKAIIGVPHKWNVFLRPLVVKLLERFGKYPYSPERPFSRPELRAVVERSGLVASNPTGILSMPGFIRMADLFLYQRDIPLHRLTPLLQWPFDYLESHFKWPAYFGYLIAIVGQKAPADGPGISSAMRRAT